MKFVVALLIVCGVSRAFDDPEVKSPEIPWFDPLLIEMKDAEDNPFDFFFVPSR